MALGRPTQRDGHYGPEVANCTLVAVAKHGRRRDFDAELLHCNTIPRSVIPVPLMALVQACSGRLHMGPPIPTQAELSRFASSVRAQRKATAQKLLTERAVTREELVKLGLMSVNDGH